MLEVEIKAMLDHVPAEYLQQLAIEKGFQKAGRLQETDIYFNGISRNFMETDEALRLRTCKDPDTKEVRTLVTYKGPTLDQMSSTRIEYETSVGDSETMKNLLAALGFQEVFTVDKDRQEWKLKSDDRGEITLCIDTVEGLGSFMELETMIEDSREENKDAAVEVLLSILDEFGVPRENLTGKSYLEMLYFAAVDRGKKRAEPLR